MLRGGVGLGNGGAPLRAEINETEQARVTRACFYFQTCRALNSRAWPASAPDLASALKIGRLRRYGLLPLRSGEFRPLLGAGLSGKASRT